MNDIYLEKGKYGLRAVLRTAWSDEIASEIRTHRCLELEINHAKGWVGNDLSFLMTCPWLQALKIIDFKIQSVEPIHALHELRALEVMTYCRTELRFSAFPKLEDCALEWRPKAESLFDCLTLKSLFINSYKGRNLTEFSRLEKIESLAVLNSPIETLDGIASLEKLRFLRLGNLKKLQSLAGIEALTNLEELEVHTCCKIGTIKEIAALKKLRKLHLNNVGEINSLKPIDAIGGLESVLFYESTNIMDGDLSPLIRQKSLSSVSFQNRRHYSHRREEISCAYSK
jgi:Leucine-rich repeat (LRR) protein